MSANYCVIMAGGIGSRFWPMSRQTHPKQFIDILGTGETLLQATYRRVKSIFPPENVLVVTNEDYVNIVAQQLPEIPKENILAEPLRKNTAPCIAYAAYKIRKRNPNATMLITPADHLVTKEEELVRILNMGIEYASENDVLLTMGIKPTRPDTGYGYIQFSQKSNSNPEIKKVKTFTEKPEIEIEESESESDEPEIEIEESESESEEPDIEIEESESEEPDIEIEESESESEEPEIEILSDTEESPDIEISLD